MSDRAFPDMWVDPADDPRANSAEVSGERDTLRDYLHVYRLTLELKCQELDAEQMARRSVPPSTMSLLGLVRHLAGVEHHWFRRVMGDDLDLPRLYRTPDGVDLSFDGAVADDLVVAEAWESWRREVAHAEQVVEATPSLDARSTMADGTTLELRDLLVHMVEEYARHCGHADLLRECIDGRTGQ